MCDAGRRACLGHHVAEPGGAGAWRRPLWLPERQSP